MSKYIIDTSVIVYDPMFYENLINAELIIPIGVLVELDKLKTYSNEVGRNSRVFIRNLDKMEGDISSGIELENGSTLKVLVKNVETSGDPTHVDNQIISLALEEKAVVVSRDINVRVRAKAVKLEVRNYESEKKDISDLYTGYRTSNNAEQGQFLKDNKYLSAFEFNEINEMMPNECIHFRWSKNSVLGKKVGEEVKIIDNIAPWGLKARNIEQQLLINLCMDDNIKFVSTNGPAGSGKTLLLMAAALELVVNKKIYDKITIYRPVIPLKNTNLGYLPGSIDEKLLVWAGPIHDALECLTSNIGRKNKKSNQTWMDKLGPYAELITMNSLEHVRGRTLSGVVILDECQQLEPEIMRTVCSRMSENSKLLVTGDPSQIDSDLDAISNGLSYVIDRFKESDLTGHITLKQCERGRFADLSVKLL